MDTAELVAATETLPAEDIAELAPDLPPEVMDHAFQRLPPEERERLRAAMSFEDDIIGALMDFDDVQLRSDVTLEAALRYLRRFDELLAPTDPVFVVGRDEKPLDVLRWVLHLPGARHDLPGAGVNELRAIASGPPRCPRTKPHRSATSRNLAR